MPPRGKKKKASKKKRKKDLAVHPHSPTHSQTDSSAHSPSHSQDGNGGNDENDAIAVSRNGAGREDCEDKGENPELDNGDKVANGPENGDGNRKGKRKMEDEAGVMNGDSYAGYGSSGSSSDGESRPIGNKSESELGKLSLSVDPAKEVVPLTENVPQTREAASIEDSHVLEANIMNMVPLPHGTHRDGSESHKGSVAHNSLEDKVNGESQPVDSQLERELEKLAAFADPIKEVISSAQEAPRPKEAPSVDDSQVLDADNFQPDENKKEMSPFSSENPIDGGCDWHTESGHKVNGEAQPVENQSGKELKKSVPSVDSFKQVVSTMEVAPQAKEVSLGDDSQDLHVRNFGPEEDENKITPFPHENPSEGCECHKESGDQYMPEDKVSIEEITQDKEAALVDDSQVLDPGDLLSKENSKMASLPRENPGDGCESQKESGCSDCPENKVNLPLAPVQRSSWKNCCGLLEVLMGSKN